MTSCACPCGCNAKVESSATTVCRRCFPGALQPSAPPQRRTGLTRHEPPAG